MNSSLLWKFSRRRHTSILQQYSWTNLMMSRYLSFASLWLPHSFGGLLLGNGGPPGGFGDLLTNWRVRGMMTLPNRGDRKGEKSKWMQ